MGFSIRVQDFLSFLAMICVSVLSAQEAKTAYSEQDSIVFDGEIPQIVVIAQKDRLMSRAPGSAAYIEPLALRRIAPLTGNEVFRKLPGLHVVDEEGMGLRMNIGVRGLDPDRSSNVLVLEDGIPVQLNPYGEPELYYTPSIDRMAAIEVLKGSGQIAFGPRTIGGVINYITADAPSSLERRISVKTGSGGFLSTQVQYGNTIGNVGIVTNYLYKTADKIGVTGFDVHDFNTKITLPTGKRSKLGIKMQVYDEVSNSTYIGLTQPMYDRGEYFPVMAPDDRLQVRRYALSGTHKFFISNQLSLQTTAYAYSISRNWRRQLFSSSATAADLNGVVWGDAAQTGGAVYMRRSTGLRNRSFTVGGLESKLSYDARIGKRANHLEVGARLLSERANEQELTGASPRSESGQLQLDERRPGDALSAFVHDQFFVHPKLSITAGVRYENYTFDRQILLYRNSAGAYRDTNIVASNRVSAVIPGLGFNYVVAEKVNIFGGIHKGFAPPTIKNSVSNTGEVFALDAQESWNSELGLRGAWPRGLQVEVTGFLMDFQKQIIPVAESAGGTGSGFANAGRTRHIGAEAGLRLDFGQLFDWKNSFYWEANATYTEARFSTDRFVGADKTNIKGNALPYAPRFLTTQTLGWASKSGLDVQVTGNYVAAQFTDVLNTSTAAANGRSGEIPAYFLADASLRQTITRWNVVFFASSKNISDARYIASRRPTGIKVGNPRIWMVGAEWKF